MSAARIPFDGGSLVAADDQRLLVLNRAASEIWDALDAGWSPRELARTLSSRQDLDIEQLDREIGAIASARDGHRAEAPVLAGAEETLAAGDPTWSARWRCRIRGLNIGFYVEEARRARALRPLLAHLECGDGPESLRIEVRNLGGARSLVCVDGRPRAEIHGEVGLRDTVHAAIIGHLWPGRAVSPLIHGGAVALRGKGICLPAFAGSGKTTLIAWLAGRGFRYLADDMCPVDRSGQIIPWPVPLNVKEGSWAALSPLYPDLAQGQQLTTSKGRSTLIVPASEVWQADPISLRLLIFPRFEPGSGTGVEALSPFMALERLVEAGMWLGHPLTDQNVRAFLAWLETVPAYALTYGRLEEAEAALRGLLGD